MLKYFGGLSLCLVAITLGASLPMNPDETEQFNNDHRIVGGLPVNIVKHAHQISLRYKGINSTLPFGHMCGGSIYSSNVIITAAHCVSTRVAKNFAVVAGTNNRRGGDGVLALVRQIIVHENYGSSGINNDIALLILSMPLPLNNVTIASIPLTTKAPKHGDRAVITGWGTTSAGGYSSDKLLEVEVPIVSNDRCDNSYAVYYGSGSISESMICAGLEGVGGKDACQGDSGGPLVVNRRLAGIVSWGRGCALPDFPGVYTNVALFLNWIADNIKTYA